MWTLFKNRKEEIDRLSGLIDKMESDLNSVKAENAELKEKVNKMYIKF